MVSGEGLEKRGFAEVSSEQSEGERRRAGFNLWMIGLVGKIEVTFRKLLGC